MTVEELINVLDKRIVFNIFQMADSELLFDSDKWDDVSYTRKCWDDIKTKKVMQLSPSDNGEEVDIYIAVENQN